MKHYKGVFDGYVVSGWEYTLPAEPPQWKLLIYSNSGELAPARQYLWISGTFHPIHKTTVNPDATLNMHYGVTPVEIPMSERSAISKALEAWRDSEPTKV